MPMIDTAEVVAARYNISREAQDAYGLESQRRTAAAQQARRFEAEIAPIATRMALTDKATGEVSHRDVTVSQDEGPRPDTTPGRSRFFEAGAWRRQDSDCRQCQPIVRRRVGVRGHGSETRARRRVCSRSARSAASSPQAASLMRWASARSSPFRGSSSGTDSKSPTSTLGIERSLRRAGDLLPRPARHRSAKSSMSMAAQSPWAIPMG